MELSRRSIAAGFVVLSLSAGACGSDDVGSTSAEAGGSDTALTYQLVDTGQSAFFDTEGEIDEPGDGDPFQGQDAAYEGVQMSFTDNGDGTVTDLVTGLVWEQDPTDDGTIWSEAVAYCEALELGGSSEWRIPNLKELFSISDFGQGWPYLDTDYFDLVDTAIEKDQQYWTSNYYEVDTELAAQDQAFGVNHMTGHIKAYSDGESIDGEGTGAAPQEGGPTGVAGSESGAPDDRQTPGGGREGESPEGQGSGGEPADGGPPQDGGGDSPASKYVRCVSGNDYGTNDFADNGDGTITDAATGLMWAQDDSGEGLDWTAALELAVTANESNYLGYSDWRVPDVKELQSIADYSGVYPAIDTSLFNVTDEDSYYWTSTSAYFSEESPGYYYAWYVAAGYAIDGDGNDSHGAGAVRFDTKEEGGPAGEEPERIYNYVRLVRNA